ncbi:PAS domain-containing sensor histidine kinase [Candidatus Daviesbacteria bacterium]|nr:PAS domain-containing sensor histidine kinase [Candidatus Daviesbacteria bacterium]
MIKELTTIASAFIARFKNQPKIFEEGDMDKAILSAMGEGLYVVDEDYKVVLMNDMAVKMTGLQADKVIGQDLRKLITVFKDDRPLPNEERPASQVLKTGKVFMAGLADNLSIQPKSGPKFPVSATITPLKVGGTKGAVVVFRDISLEKQSKESIEKQVHERTKALIEEQARLDASINTINVGFILTDNKANIVTINPTAKHILCKSSTDLEPGAFHSSLIFNVKCTMEDIEKTFKSTYDLRTKILSSIDKKNPIEVKELQFNNLILHIFIAPIVVLEGDELVIIGSVVLVEDITLEKVIERSKDEFFSIASHELRTPLTSIRGNAAMLHDYYADKIEDNTFREMIQDIRESSIRLIEIVNDFLNVSRLEQGKIIFKKEQFDIVPIINEAIREVENLALQKGLYLRLATAKRFNSKVEADQERTKEVVANLISNAIKYTEKGGIELSLTTKDGFLKVSVTDTGRGIAREQQNLLFRKFQQAGESLLTRDTTKGTGLGLYIARMLMESMGGEIYLAASEVGKGSTFTFELPVAKT